MIPNRNKTFRALKLSNLENFGALKLSNQKNFRALKYSNLGKTFKAPKTLKSGEF